MPPKLPIGDPQPDDLEVKRIYILHRFHRFGVGRRLMNIAADYANEKKFRHLLLGVYSRNSDAIAFLRTVGLSARRCAKFRVGHNEYDDVNLRAEFVIALARVRNLTTRRGSSGVT